METVTRTKIKASIAEEFHRVHAKRTKAEVKSKPRDTFVGVFQIGNSAGSIEAWTVPFSLWRQ